MLAALVTADPGGGAAATAFAVGFAAAAGVAIWIAIAARLLGRAKRGRGGR